MSRWTAECSEILAREAGRISDAEIGHMTGHAAITIRKRREALGLPAYTHQRRAWSRRDWLLNTISGLDIRISPCRT